MQTITLSGEPKCTQTIYGLSCRGPYLTTYMTREGKALKEQYQWEAKSQWKGPPIDGDVAVHVLFYFATKRRRDLDNQNKLMAGNLTNAIRGRNRPEFANKLNAVAA